MPEIYNGGVCLRTEVFGVKLIPGEYRFCFLYYHGLMVALPVFCRIIFQDFIHKVSK